MIDHLYVTIVATSNITMTMTTSWTYPSSESSPSWDSSPSPDPIAMSQSRSQYLRSSNVVEFWDTISEILIREFRCFLLYEYGKFCKSATQPYLSCSLLLYKYGKFGKSATQPSLSCLRYFERRFTLALLRKSRNLARSLGDFPSMISLLLTDAIQLHYFYGAAAAEPPVGDTTARAAVYCLHVELSSSFCLVLLSHLLLDLLIAYIYFTYKVFYTIKAQFSKVIRSNKLTSYMDTTTVYFLTESKPYYLDWSIPELDWSAEVDYEFPLSGSEDEALIDTSDLMDPASKKLRGRTAADKESECLERFGRSENFESDTSGPEAGGADVGAPEVSASESPDLHTTPQKSKKRKQVECSGSFSYLRKYCWFGTRSRC